MVNRKRLIPEATSTRIHRGSRRFPPFTIQYLPFTGSFFMKRKAKTYTISAVADQYGIHPQTLRLYEREGLLKPSRSEGNTRLYTDPDLARLELILSLTRDLGVNLAGVEIILNMREKMDAMQHEFERFFQYLQSHADELTNFVEPPAEGTTDALVPLTRAAALCRRSASRS